MEIIGWCKNCGEPITENDFQEGETEFSLSDELISTVLYSCPKCEQNIYNTIVYDLKPREESWEGLTKADPNYGIWKEDKED